MEKQEFEQLARNDYPGALVVLFDAVVKLAEFVQPAAPAAEPEAQPE
jgi:hypothetical protein